MKPTVFSVIAALPLLALTWFGGTQAPESTAPRATFPALLSETGYFKSVADHQISEGFEPYQVNVPAWADDADKLRFFRIPAGTSAEYRRDDAWIFPTKTVFLQTLVMTLGSEKRRIETRVIFHGEKGLEFATYVWRPDHSEADLVHRGRSVDIESKDSFRLWKVTPTKKCSECHNPETQSLLGMTTQQLNVTDAEGSQLSRLAAKGLVKGVPDDLRPLPKLTNPKDTSQPLERRARSYLDTNCATCHRPGGNGSDTLDLRYATAFEDTGMGPKKEVLLRGKPGKSWIYLRMVYDGSLKMPGILTIQTDTHGANVVSDWVQSLK